MPTLTRHWHRRSASPAQRAHQGRQAADRHAGECNRPFYVRVDVALCAACRLNLKSTLRSARPWKARSSRDVVSRTIFSMLSGAYILSKACSASLADHQPADAAALRGASSTGDARRFASRTSVPWLPAIAACPSVFSRSVRDGSTFSFAMKLGLPINAALDLI